MNLSKNTQVVVVTYNPEIELLGENLSALIKQFQFLLVVDNNSKNASEIESLCKKISSTIILSKLKSNMGIAYAQNIGLAQAFDRKLSWLLTMDQDSIIPVNFAHEYEKMLEKHGTVGLVAWNQGQRPSRSQEMINDWFIVSSGCLHNVEAINRCHGFDNQLFIDHVDTDMNIKIRNIGYKTVTTNKVQLIHYLGEKTDKKTIRGKPYFSHSPARVYYMVRNGVVLFKRYFFKRPLWVMALIKFNIREGIYLLCFQKNKLKNFKLLLVAWFDGIFNRLGKYRE